MDDCCTLQECFSLSLPLLHGHGQKFQARHEPINFFFEDLPFGGSSVFRPPRSWQHWLPRAAPWSNVSGMALPSWPRCARRTPPWRLAFDVEGSAWGGKNLKHPDHPDTKSLLTTGK